MKAQPQRIYISLGIFFVTGVARELCTMQSGRGVSVGVRCTVQESGHLGVDNGRSKMILVPKMILLIIRKHYRGLCNRSYLLAGASPPNY